MTKIDTKSQLSGEQRDCLQHNPRGRMILYSFFCGKTNVSTVGFARIINEAFQGALLFDKWMSLAVMLLSCRANFCSCEVSNNFCQASCTSMLTEHDYQRCFARVLLLCGCAKCPETWAISFFACTGWLWGTLTTRDGISRSGKGAVLAQRAPRPVREGKNSELQIWWHDPIHA